MRALFLLLTFFCFAGAVLLAVRLVAARAHQAAYRRMDVLLGTPSLQAAAPAAPAHSWVPAFLTRKLARAGYEPAPRQIALAAAGFVVVTLILCGVAGPVGAGLFAIAVVMAGFAVLEYRGAANVRALGSAMLGFLERMQQLLSVGNSLPVALRRAVDNSPPAVARSLASVVRRIDNGGEVSESIDRCATVFNLLELRLLATATRTNLRFGGSMTGILKNIIENIRRRGAIERELRSNTTQIRASAWVLALLPIVVASLVMLTNHMYARWFLATPMGHKMIVYCLVSQVIGALCMRLIVRTRY